MYCLLVFATLTKAQRGAKILHLSGISAGVIKSPKGAAEDGCTQGVRIAETRLTSAREQLARVNLLPKKIYRVYNDGRVRQL